ncbi:hypothetical protein Zmor_009187 [Zophobas morio]|uniref:Uncharacterized protein n=1 Tax=Zophobas morio TaxID=2755281 RepID=A0AA38ILJ2_9CUCU|nr:hypothetical protein Zmor_009187 [Zophobas morio]
MRTLGLGQRLTESTQAIFPHRAIPANSPLLAPFPHRRPPPPANFPTVPRTTGTWLFSGRIPPLTWDDDENSYDPEYVALKINDFRKVAAPLERDLRRPIED